MIFPAWFDLLCIPVRQVAEERWRERVVLRLRPLGRLAELEPNSEGHYQAVHYGKYGRNAPARLLFLDLEGEYGMRCF